MHPMGAGPFLLLVDNSITKETAPLGLSCGSHAQKFFWSLCLHLFRYHSHVLPIGGENLPAKPLSIHTWALCLPCSSRNPSAGPPTLTYHIPSMPWASHTPSAGPPTLTHPRSQHALGFPQTISRASHSYPPTFPACSGVTTAISLHDLGSKPLLGFPLLISKGS